MYTKPMEFKRAELINEIVRLIDGGLTYRQAWAHWFAQFGIVVYAEG